MKIRLHKHDDTETRVIGVSLVRPKKYLISVHNKIRGKV